MREGIRWKLRSEMILSERDFKFMKEHPEDAEWLKDHIEPRFWLKFEPLMEAPRNEKLPASEQSPQSERSPQNESPP